ncbi:MAG TPA: OmpH family outer membrane protein [Cytophagaceae bacterium]|jgi:outer membrane protein|nr:OmpH family outer membrane protein [Cytophagaceae bacterium]
MKYIYQIVGVVVLSVLISFGVSRWLTPKVVYVRVAEVVNKYEGMLEAKNSYKQKMANWQANVDTLELDYQKMVSKYQLESASMSAGQKKEREESLRTQRQNVQNYITTLEKKAQEEDEKMTKAVINQINASIEEYAKSKGYDYVLGTTNEGNILYGVKSNDITDETLVYLNNQYKQK